MRKFVNVSHIYSNFLDILISILQSPPDPVYLKSNKQLRILNNRMLINRTDANMNDNIVSNTLDNIINNTLDNVGDYTLDNLDNKNIYKMNYKVSKIQNETDRVRKIQKDNAVYYKIQNLFLFQTGMGS